MPNQFIQPKELAAIGLFTHVVVTEGKKTIYIAGQVAVDAKGEVVGKGDLRAQTKQVFENLRTALGAGGATLNDVVKMTMFIVNYKPEMRPMLTEVRSQYVSNERPPANTLVGVTSLAREEFLIEIEAIAVI